MNISEKNKLRKEEIMQKFDKLDLQTQFNREQINLVADCVVNFFNTMNENKIKPSQLYELLTMYIANLLLNYSHHVVTEESIKTFPENLIGPIKDLNQGKKILACAILDKVKIAVLDSIDGNCEVID